MRHKFIAEQTNSVVHTQPAFTSSKSMASLNDVFIVSLTDSTHSGVFIVDFEQVNGD